MLLKQIEQYQDKYEQGVLDLWNTQAVKDGYKPMTHESFAAVFTMNAYFSPRHTFVCMQDGRVEGFACGCTGNSLPLGEHSGYITCVVLSPAMQTDENYSLLLSLLEKSFMQEGKEQSEILFFNPMMLPWYIPGTLNREHNNAPGVWTESVFYGQLLKNYYVQRTTECAMYLDLKDFVIPQEIVSKEKRILEEGYEVTWFDKNRHFGMDDMLRGLNNPNWEKEITESVRKNMPVIVAAKNNRLVGFTGPVIREPSGRGYFAGIGVNRGHEGRGLGSILFFKLCAAFREIRADYMSIYTGKENPAIHIYEKAGFSIVREFAVMRKKLG